jgi:hypothetical protein
MTAQALPNDYPNLAQMFQNLPAIAAYQSGAQTGLADDNNELLQQAHRAAQDYLAQQRPLELQELAARTRQHGVNADLAAEQTKGLRLGNNFTESTQPGKIASTNAGYEADTSASGVKKMEADGQMYGQLASQMEGLTPWEKVALVKKTLGDRIPPGLEAGLMKNADSLGEWMGKLSQHSYEQSAAARKAAADEAKRLAMIKEQRETLESVARINAQGKVDAKNAGGGKGGDKPKTMSQWEAQIRQSAAEGDEDAQRMLLTLESDRVRRAQASQEPANALKAGVLRLPQPKAPAGATVPSTTPPRASAPKAAPAGWPPGTIDNGDGTFTTPDKTTYRPKAQ